MFCSAAALSVGCARHARSFSGLEDAQAHLELGVELEQRGAEVLEAVDTRSKPARSDGESHMSTMIGPSS